MQTSLGGTGPITNPRTSKLPVQQRSGQGELRLRDGQSHRRLRDPAEARVAGVRTNSAEPGAALTRRPARAPFSAAPALRVAPAGRPHSLGSIQAAPSFRFFHLIWTATLSFTIWKAMTMKFTSRKCCRSDPKQVCPVSSGAFALWQVGVQSFQLAHYLSASGAACARRPNLFSLCSFFRLEFVS